MSEELYPIDLGPVTQYEILPVEITAEDSPYWLVRSAEGVYRLLLAVCPHAGGDIRPHEDIFYCPLHFWTFNGETGACLTLSDRRLAYRQVIERNGRLYAAAKFD